MKTQRTISICSFIAKTLLFAGIVCLVITAHASTFWNGVNTNYTEPSAGAADVLVAGKVGVARGTRLWLYNSFVDGGAGTGTPSDTAWAVGSASMAGNLNSTVTNLSFIPFSSVRTTAQDTFGDVGDYLLNGGPGGGPITFVVHLLNEDIYLTVTFKSWGVSDGGGFAYARSTPSAVVPPTPTVSITRPSSGTILAAPANVTISANATVSSGSVTNVSFFGNGSRLGSSASAPFSFTANGLGAGPYALTAVAIAAGVSATSSVVNVSIVTPVVTSLSGATVTANNQFVFGYNVNTGLSYVVESSPGVLSGFAPLATNIPASSPAFFTNPISGSQNFYRVGRMPNP